jgi:hypothetical protein
MKRIAPAIGLFFLAPFIAEYLLGDFPLTKLGYLVIMAPMYGGGALLIREVVRRSGKGWPTIFVLAFAYAVLEEAFTTQTLFNPNYLKLNLHLLDHAYIPALGIGAWWTIFVLTLHTVWSISTSIALIEACVPDRATTPWLHGPGLTIDAILFVLAVIASTRFEIQHDHFLATRAQFSVSALVVVLAVVAAFLLPASQAGMNPSPAPDPFALGVLALIAASFFLMVPPALGWGAVAIYLVLDLVVIVSVTALSHRPGWGGRHRLALAAGAALAYGWHAFLTTPVGGGKNGLVVRGSNAVCLLIVCAVIGLAARRQARHGTSTVTPGPSEALPADTSSPAT